MRVVPLSQVHEEPPEIHNLSSIETLAHPHPALMLSLLLLQFTQALKYLEVEGMHLTHYGMGYKGLCALSAALKVMLDGGCNVIRELVFPLVLQECIHPVRRQTR